MENNYYFGNINNRFYNLNIQQAKEFPLRERNYINEIGQELTQVKQQINYMNKSADKYFKNKANNPKDIINNNNLNINNDIFREMNNLSNTNIVPHHFGNYNSINDINLNDYNYIQNNNRTMRSVNNNYNKNKVNYARFLSQSHTNTKRITNKNSDGFVVDHNIQLINSNKNLEINNNINNINAFNRKINSSKNKNNMNLYNNFYNYNSSDKIQPKMINNNENLLSQKRNVTIKSKEIKNSPSEDLNKSIWKKKYDKLVEENTVKP